MRKIGVLEVLHIVFLVFSVTENVGALTGDEVCQSCHRTEYESWSLSDHARAMAEANDETVLGDFSGVTVSHHGVRVDFRRNGEAFEAVITEAGGEPEIHRVAYVFGHSPLQQYLVPMGDGKYQVLPFAWDSRSKAEEGQRWFPNYPNETLTASDRLHWTGPLQNWNGMCADCHSSGLERRYDAANNRFDTRYTSVNVSCSSCHAEARRHAAAMLSDGSSAAGNDSWKDELVDALRQEGGFKRSESMATAYWTGAQPRKRPEIEVCAACHSLREPLTDGIHVGKAYLDQFTPSLLDDPLYFADGQIREEVYVWGSFLQSRMYQLGVSCLDCHDSHSMAVKVKGNGLCTQCHDAKVFDRPDHHHHTVGREGSQCVDCHMPTRTYMTVDPRRDHGFKVPRPELSVVTGAPNPCTTCHSGKENSWASGVIEHWFPERRTRSTAPVTIHRARQGDPAARPGLAKLAGDPNEPEIVRATALSLIPNVASPSLERLAAAALKSAEPLIRIGAIRGVAAMPAEERHRLVSPLLKDEFKAVRIEAARNLLDTPQANLAEPAYGELMGVDSASAWRGEGRVNLARHYLARRDFDSLEASYRQAIDQDPGFVPSRISLAEFLRQTGRAEEGHAILEKAAAALDHSAPELDHALGLSYVRLRRMKEALGSLKQAAEGAPTNARFTYVYLVALDGSGDRNAAVTGLNSALKVHPFDESLLRLALAWGLRSGDEDQTRQALHGLLRLHPDDAALRQMQQRLDGEAGK